MLCPECQAPLNEKATHCVECGASVQLNSSLEARPFAVRTAENLQSLPLSMYQANAIVQKSQVIQLGDLSLETIPLKKSQPQAQTASDYEPSILQQWLKQSRENPQSSMRWLIQIIYFFGVGIWLSQIWLIVAWVMGLTIFGLPISKAMLQFLPMIMFLHHYRFSEKIDKPNPDPLPKSLRIIYFFGVGFWMSLVWLELAWLAQVTVVATPLSQAMIQANPTILTLEKF